MKPGRLTLMFTAALTLPNPAPAADDLPPVGRSRFDQLIGNAPVPYPFSRLLEAINRQMQPDAGGLPPLKVTLVPLGRSLQREAGAPDYFRYPRVVAAADGANRPGHAPLKDRLFLGYHEKGEVIEVISYNDDAGRFEFQVVRDYRQGGTPQLFYARRSLCLACHQNAAPIFARPLWDETPANPEIAARLRAARRDFYRVRLTGTDVAYFIDAATDRANLFAVWQTLWREGCGPGATGARCRRDAFAAALAYARNGTLPRADALPALASRWKQRWPHGLAVPNPDLPNRDPLAPLQDAANDPLLLRPPLETWHAPDTTAFVVGLAGMLDVPAARALPPDAGAALDRMLARGAFDGRPYALSLLDALRGELGQPRARPPERLPAPRMEPVTAAQARNPLVAPFRDHCASCHDTTLPHPPNFLHGTAEEIEARLDHCAERIFVRLSRADAPSGTHGVTPMPPAAALAARGIDAARWAASPELAALKRAIGTRLQGRDPQALLRRPYASLRACLPPYRPEPAPPGTPHAAPL
jgi:mono/diheme cytochrome c family protein